MTFKIQPKKKSALALEDVKYPLYTSSFGGSQTVTIDCKKIINIVHDYVKDQHIKVVPPEGTSKELNVLDSLDSFVLPVEKLNENSYSLEVHLTTYKALQAEFKKQASNSVEVFSSH